MSLGDITDPCAVEAALREFDSIGRDAFLHRYGFGPARKYFLVRAGRQYDSKAIVGVAHGFQFPTLGPLSAGSFAGGENHAARKLRLLGFEVRETGKSDGGRTWAFCANPNRYRIMDAVAHLEYDLWTVGRSDVRAGDRAIVWQTRDEQGRRGVVAFAEVLTDPEDIADDTNPYWDDRAGGSAVISRVRVAYSVPEGLPLWVDDSDTGDFLKSLSVARSQGGTVFHVAPDQWGRLVSLSRHTGLASEALEVERAIRNRIAGRTGQGFGLTGAERRVVERHAMALATEFFERDWESVADVATRCSYDLLCSRFGEELRVEVKGTTTAGTEIVLTRNEVEEAKTGGYALFVVSEILLYRSGQEPSASGGLARCFSPWSPDPDALRPISYQCSIDHSAGMVVEDLQ